MFCHSHADCTQCELNAFCPTNANHALYMLMHRSVIKPSGMIARGLHYAPHPRKNAVEENADKQHAQR